VALHTLIGALGHGQAGAIANLTASAATPHIVQLAKDAGFAEGTLAHDLLVAAATTAVGAGVGGRAGAAAAFNADANNRQLHPIEKSRIEQNARNFARWLKSGQEPTSAEVAQAERRLAQQAWRQIQLGPQSKTDQEAMHYLLNFMPRELLPGDPAHPGENVSWSFRASETQRPNYNMYADLVVNDPSMREFYWRNGIVQPSHDEVVAAFNRDRGQRSLGEKLTTAAGLLSGAVTLAPVANWALTACLANIANCGIQAAEIAAGDALGPISFSTLPLASRAGVRGATSAELANAQWMAARPGNTAAWQPGTAVLTADLAVGTRVRMYVNKDQAEAIEAGRLGDGLGRWATFDDPAGSLFQVRNQTALTEGFKSTDRGVYLVELEVTKKMPANIGFVGPQPGNGTGKEPPYHAKEPARYIGGGTQIQIIDFVNRGSYFRNVSPPKCIGGC
jgi:hypothetical protein